MSLADKLKKLSEKMKNVASPGDGSNLKIKVSEEVRNQRYKTCLSCEHLYKPSSTCKKCGCFMSLKTYLPYAECPVGKWGKEESKPVE